MWSADDANKLKGLLPNYSGKAPAADPGATAYDWLGGFTKSAVESIPELIGITPSTETQNWRAQHPVGSVASEIAGMSIPYTGWFKATKALKSFDRVIEGLGDAKNAPVLAGALREGARFAPLELGRVAVSQVVGDQSLTDMASGAAINLALGAGVGGLIEGVASAGMRRAPIQSLVPGVDISAPVQLQLRQMKDSIAKNAVPVEQVPQVNFRINEFKRTARTEELPFEASYVADLDPTMAYDRKALKSQLNRLFKTRPGDTSILQRRRFVESSRDFATKSDWSAKALEAGLPADFEEFAQYPRFIKFNAGADAAKYQEKLQKVFEKRNNQLIDEDQMNTEITKLSGWTKADQTAKNVNRHLTRYMESAGNNWFLTREAEDGMFIMAKKIKGEAAKGSRHDEWAIFKTDSPGKFLPDMDKWAKAQISKNSWSPNAQIAADGGEVYNAAKGFMEQFPLNNYRSLERKGKVRENVEKLLPKGVRDPGNELFGRMQDAVREYLAPARVQFKNSPRANWVHTVAKATYDAAETTAQEVLYGRVKLDPGKSAFFNALRNTREEGENIKDLIDPLSSDQLTELHRLWRDQVKPEDLPKLVGRGQLSPETAKTAEGLHRIEQRVWQSLQKAQGATGQPVSKGLMGHMGLSRQWEGDSRIAIRDEGGKVVAVAAGKNRRAAQMNAEEMLKEHPSWRKSEEFELSQLRELPADLAPIIKNPGFLLERQNVLGFKWDKTPFTKDELLEAYSGAVRARYKHQANLTVDDLLSRDKHQLIAEDPVSYRMLEARMSDLSGRKSAFSDWQNKVADKILAPVLGNNSADKIVSITNSSMWHLQLGALKMSYPILNAMTFIQTVMPEVAFLTGGEPARLAGAYTYFAAGGTKGPVGGVGILNPMTMMAKSFREMKTPSKELVSNLEKAANERVIDPRLVEEYIGESATKVRDLRSAFSSGGNFTSWLKAVSEFMPAQSERLSRAHAFTVGHMVGRDFLKLEGDKLYSFSRQFTERTMYLYSASDRPRIFTTPAGSMLGLFKNWMMNYMATMVEYSGAAVRGQFAPLAWQTAGTAAVGGMAATPIYWAADGFSRAISGEGMLQNTYESWGHDIANGAMFGLPAALTGTSFYSQTASPIANPARDASMLFGMAAWDRVGATASAMGGAWDHWAATGEHPGKDPRVREQLVRAFAPVTVYRMIGSLEEGMIRSLGSGKPMVKDVGMVDRMLYTMGFNPVELDRGLAVAEELFADKEKKRTAISQYGEAWAHAAQEKDSIAMNRILKRATLEGLDVSSVIKSGIARNSKQDQTLIERNFGVEAIQRYKAVLEDPEVEK